MGGPKELTVVLPAVARSTAERILLQLGARGDDAETVADVLLEADLRGQHSHGLMRLPTIVGRVRAGLILPEAGMRVVASSPAVASVDAGYGFGHAMAKRAMQLARDIASRAGVGLVGVQNNNHIGMLGYYVDEAARAGYVTVVCTTTEAMVHPFGGAERLLGTNPISIGVPAEPDPFVLDFSTSQTAIGKIIDSAQRGSPIPLEWALDSLGEPTSDAAEALEGAINPFGGAKGYGLSLAVALLAGLMVGSAPNPEVVGTLDTEHVVNKGDLFLAIDPRCFPNGGELALRAGSLLEQLRDSRPAPGTDRVRVPGDRGRERREHCLREGIELPAGLWASIEALAG